MINRHLFYSLFFLSIQVYSSFGRPPKTIDEAKECVLFVSTFDNWKRPLANGSAFVVEEEGIQWVYTNAHVIEGATIIEFSDSEGGKLRNFGKFQCLSEESGSGKVEGIAIGGDGIRLQLKEKRELAFKISEKSLRADAGGPNSVNKIITIGDNDGDKIMEVLEGEVKAASDAVALSTCKTAPGSSGGVIIEPESFEVVGLNTWGFRVIDSSRNKLQLQNIWTDEWLAGCSLVKTFMWIDMSAASFLKGTKLMTEFQETVRMLYFIYGLVPSGDGFKDYNYTNEFAGTHYSTTELLKRYEDHKMLKAIVNVNRKISNKAFNVNIMDLVRAYAKGLNEVRALYSEQKSKLENNVAPYFKVGAIPNAYFTIGDLLHEGLIPAQEWFTNKASVGGQMPLGKWYNHKPLAEF